VSGRIGPFLHGDAMPCVRLLHAMDTGCWANASVHSVCSAVVACQGNPATAVLQTRTPAMDSVVQNDAPTMDQSSLYVQKVARPGTPLHYELILKNAFGTTPSTPTNISACLIALYPSDASGGAVSGGAGFEDGLHCGVAPHVYVLEMIEWARCSLYHGNLHSRSAMEFHDVV
jgi:hypothetical protein